MEMTAAQQAALEAKEKAKEERKAKRQAELAQVGQHRAPTSTGYHQQLAVVYANSWQWGMSDRGQWAVFNV